jgi:hypothetical protein
MVVNKFANVFNAGILWLNQSFYIIIHISETPFSQRLL